MKSLRKLADRAANVLVGQTDAGACVPENGQSCGCVNHQALRYACKGNCIVVGSC